LATGLTMRKVTVDISDELRDQLIQWAREERRPLANLLRHIATSAVEKRQANAAPAEAAHG
jgi:CopG-like RHH_1 or ribbon-helix-helix domain, RHH_5